MLITSCDPLKIFVYKDGMARFATEEYDIKDTPNYDNLCMHLTNYAINKESENYEHGDNADDDTGHKRSTKVVFERMANEGVDIDKIEN